MIPPRGPPEQLQSWHVFTRDRLQAEFMLVASQEEALRSRRAERSSSKQSQVTLEGGLRAYEALICSTCCAHTLQSARLGNRAC